MTKAHLQEVVSNLIFGQGDILMFLKYINILVFIYPYLIFADSS